MKKLFTLFLALIASMGIIYASDTQVDGIWYDFDESYKTATVTYRGSSYNDYSNEYSSSVVIPSSVTYNGTTYSVTSIGNRAFEGCSSLTSVTIPNSVTSIGDDAFSWCESLTSVTIGNSVTSIGESAFAFCYSLTSVTIPNSVTSIGDYVFRDCFSLTSITIPNSVTSIGDYAFYCCIRLKSITIPNSVTSIGKFAFYSCNRLKSITIPNSVTSIEYGAFWECSSLTSITIPNSVTSIGEYAFAECSSLTSVTIPNSVTSIGEYAFAECSSLTSVTIPNSVTSIGSGAFEGTGVYSNEYNWEYDVLYINDCLISAKAFISGAYTIEAGTRLIADAAFRGCSSLTSVTIPNSVKSIGDRAFYNCSSLTSVTIEAETPPTLGYNAEEVFKNTNNCPIYVPGSAVNAYKTAWWRPYADRIVGMSDCVNDTWLQTGGSGLGEMTTDNSDVWFYDAKYGAKAVNQDGYIGHLMTPAKDLRGMKCVTLSFMHTHNFAGTPSNELTLWVTPDYKGSIEASQWQQLTIAPYAANTNWTFVSVSINVPVSKVGANTVFAFEYMSTAYNYATWNIKNLTLIAQCEGSTPPQPTSYTIKFKNWDGSVLQSKQVEEGKIPQYTGATPTRPDDSQYTYTFSGWTPQIVATTADATYTATFTATEIPSEECTDVNDTWLQTGGSGLGEMTTDNSGVWFYNAQYGAKGSKQGGYTGYLMTPAKDLRGMKSVTLSFMHTHKFAVTPSNELTLWVTPDYKGSVGASQWQQLTIAPYAANTNWTFVSVSINVPVSKVGANTVFAFKYMSTASNYSTWEIKNLTLIAQCATGEQGIDNIESSNLQGGDRGRLILRNGTILILRNGKTYTMQGQEVK